MKYMDGFGKIYDVPDHAVEEFEKRRTVLLVISIGVKLGFLYALMYFAWSTL